MDADNLDRRPAQRALPQPRTMVPVLVAAVLVFYAGVGLSVWFASQASNERASALSEATRARAESVATHFENQFMQDLLSLDRMGQRFGMRAGGTPEDEWRRDAGAYVEHKPWLRAIAWTDESLEIQRIEPVAGNRAALGLNLRQRSAHIAEIDAAMARQALLVTGSSDLVQGGRGVMAYIPVVERSGRRSLLIAVFDLERFATHLMARESLDTYAISLIENDKPVWSSGSGAPDDAGFGAEARVNVMGQTWVIRAEPTAALVSEYRDAFVNVNLVIGVIISLCAAAAAAAILLAHGRSRELGGVVKVLRTRETELDTARREAESANDTKSNFLATMSHEIRTPMNGVLGMLQALRQTPLDERQSMMVETIQSSGTSLMTILNEILDLSKIEAGLMQIETVEFSIEDVCRSVVRMHADSAEERGLQLVLDVRPAAAGTLSGDPQRIRQVLHNLVSNGIKFTHRGSVTISADLVAPDEAEAAELVLTVADTGIGIDAAVQDRLFSPFTQADGSTARKFGGSGLGLAICRQLCELMGGTITLHSTPGQGSAFRVSLPVGRVSGTVPAVAARTTDRSGLTDSGRSRLAPLRVLAAEDVATNQLVLRSLLGPVVAELEIVDNGALAVEAFRTGLYDVILMDMHMPVMDGWEAIRTMREIEAQRDTAATPIIALTADTMPQKVESYLRLGADQAVAKPFTLAHLADAIIAEVERARRSDPTVSMRESAGGRT
ncbi:ATP-binding protein [Maricaulis sp. CAU 1757]